MSTLAAARADNFYYPPGWDPSKGSLNKFNNSHGALGDRARKLDQGILVIRFEMPFNVWCSGCNHLIGKGVRFNAEKKQVGQYHSTRVWAFTMRAPCCQQQIVVHTDPKHGEYVIVSGAKRKTETFDAAAVGTAELPGQEERAAADDPLAKLERGELDRAAAESEASRVQRLAATSSTRYANDYASNRALRRVMRDVRRERGAADSRRAALGLPEGLTLLPASALDAVRAETRFAAAKDDEAAHVASWRAATRRIERADVFGGGGGIAKPRRPPPLKPRRKPKLGGASVSRT